MAEKRMAREIRRTKVNALIISAVAFSGVIAVAALAPGLANALGKSKYLRQRLYQARKRISVLITDGYLVLDERDGKKFIRLTEKGERFAAMMHEGTLAPKRPKRWDRKWRMLIFDIPERRRGIREKIRTTLITLGFVRLQDSVWVFPYDCEDFILVLKAEFKIGKDVLYVIADHIENDRHLRHHFSLPEA
ncbi:MAG: CRISPR-associated endonuclease Cas2 [Patescibacteria group bacterium]